MTPKPAPLQQLKTACRTGLEFLRRPRDFMTTVLGFRPGTDYARWSRNDSLQSNWDERTLLMAHYIAPGARVLEFGAGAQAIRTSLPQGCTYVPSDLVERTPDTLVCDLNSGYPDLAQLSSPPDVAVFSGVLEYIHNLPALFDWLHSNFERVIFSYATLEHTPSLIARRENGWVNDLIQDQVDAIIAQAGFQGGAVTRWRGHVIYVVTRT
jgi:hypothetical protein